VQEEMKSLTEGALPVLAKGLNLEGTKDHE